MNDKLWNALTVALTALVVVSLILNGYLLARVGTLGSDQDDTSDLESRIASLEENVTLLGGRIDDLETESDSMSDEISNLNSLILSIQTQLQNLEGDMDDLNSTLNQLTQTVSELEERIYFLEHHVVEVTIVSFRLKVISNCIIGDPCDQVRLRLSMDGLNFEYYIPILARDDLNDPVWINWTNYHPNYQLRDTVNLTMRMDPIEGETVDVDGTGDSLVVAITYDIRNGTWSGDDDDGFTDGALDGRGGEWDVELVFDIGTL